MTGHFFDDEIGAVAAALRSDPARGISSEEARGRFLRLGGNVFAQQEGPSRWEILRGQLLSPVVGVLLVAALLSGFLREWIDVGVILAIVVLNAAIGYFQEFRAERSLQLLKKLAAPRARVIRGGIPEAIAATELVPGDLIELEPGDLVPADARLVFVASLRTDESPLTGESTPVEKTTAPSRGERVGLGDRTGCVYLATSVVGGRGRALVFGTGSDTELGKIVSLVQKAEREPTTLQRDLAQLGKLLLAVCGVAILAVFAVAVLRGLPVSDMFRTAASLAVAAIPEGLPAIVTITLAIGVQRMLKRHVLLRRLASVETLGSASVICVDKTGTITHNELVVRNVVLGGDRDVLLREGGKGIEENGADAAADPQVRRLLGAAAACSNARHGGGADPTELALVRSAQRAGWSEAEIDERFPRLAEAPFDSARKRMSTLHEEGARKVLFVKGAHEVLLERCTSVATTDGVRPIDRAALARIEERSLALARNGMRVLAVAQREVLADGAVADPSHLEHDLTLLGLVAMADTPRPEAAESVRLCAEAGIRTILLTGDHVGTATAIAREVGIFRPGDVALTGVELASLDELDLAARVDRVTVYARLAPEQKLDIVRAWKRRGAVVAMTGDGVNDAPAIKEADVGIAMGQSGTDVAREAADLVVTDDNFASIVAAVEEGRGVHANIRRALLCLFAGNLSEVVLVGAATAFGLPVPLNSTQILWMNLVTDGPPALALATEPPAPDEMRRPPRNRHARMLDGGAVTDIVFQGFALYLGAMLAVLHFYDGGSGGPDVAAKRLQTGVFCTVVLSQMLNCFSFRHDRKSILTVGVRGNPWLLLAVVVSIALQVAILQWEAVRPIFGTVPIPARDWWAIATFSVIPVVLVEIRKAWLRSRGR